MNTPEPAWSSPVPGTAAGRTVSNPFGSDPAARRYAHARPYYHRSALGLAARQLGLSHARLAVDVACGTGLSTRAVLHLADHVVAIDASAAMLRAAQPHPRARYLLAAAERIPLRDAAADLATVGAAFHWSGQPAFAAWLNEAYLPRYPAPPRNAYFDPAAALPAGFGDVSYAEDDVRIPLTSTQLADYLLSQSNAATAIETGAISADTLRNQILDETTAFFPRQAHADAVFGIRVWTTVRRDEHRGTP